MRMLKIDDARVKELIRIWRTGQSGKILSKIKDELADIVYKFPGRIFGKDECDCSAFYEYVCERMESLLEKYVEQDARFSTWFFIVLRRQYYNWAKMDRRKDRLSRVRMTVIGKNSGEEIDLSDTKQFRDWNESEQSSMANRDQARMDAVKEILDHLTPDHQIVVSILFNDLDVESLSRIYRGERDLLEVFDQYVRYNQQVSQRRETVLLKLRNLNEKVSGLKDSLIKVEQACLRSEDAKKRQTALKKDISRLDRFRARARADLLKQSMNMPYDWAAEVLGWPETKVRKAMFHVKKRFMKYFVEHKGLL